MVRSSRRRPFNSGHAVTRPAGGSPGQRAGTGRRAYSLNSPTNYTDPTGHYVCSGQNANWGTQTCYDIVNNWLDYLKQYGGQLGADLVEKFWQSDQAWAVKIQFVDTLGQGVWGQTDTRFGKTISIANGGDYSSAGASQQKLYSVLFGHELDHLVNQGHPQIISSAYGEKQAYDVTWQLLANMGLDPDTTASDFLRNIHNADYSDEGLARVQSEVGLDLRPAKTGDPFPSYVARRVSGGVYTISQALGVTYEAMVYGITGCSGGTCGSPGWNPSTNGWRQSP